MPPKKRQSPEDSKKIEVASSISDQKLEMMLATDTSDAVDLAGQPADPLQQSDNDSANVSPTLCPNAVWTTAIRHGTERKDKRRQFTVAMDYDEWI